MEFKDIKIKYSFKLLVALFLLANLDIAGAAEDESGFSVEVEQLDLSFLDRLDLSLLDMYCQVCNMFFDDNDSFKEHLSNHEFSIQAEDVDDDDDSEDEDFKRRFKCDQCKKSFSRNVNLKIHQKVHAK